jgi:serine/arginine repetitive matrix protein 2
MPSQHCQEHQLVDFQHLHSGLKLQRLESGLEYGMPLMAISASPPESTKATRHENRSSFDSIIDNAQRSSGEDLLFDKTGHWSSISSDSVFGGNDSQGGYLMPN